MEIEEIRSAFEERMITKVKVGGFDVDGILRGKYISPRKFFSALEKGFGFCDVIFGWDAADALYDNAEVTGWKTGYPDALAKIDRSTFRVSPYEPDTAHFLVDFYGQDGKSHPACPRSLLKRIAARAETSGYRPRFAAELELWIFQETSETIYQKGFDDLRPLTPGMFGYSWVRSSQQAELVHEVLDTMNAYGIEIEGFHTETGPGVWEVALRYDDIVAAADQAALFKTMMKQLCQRRGLAVTFMAKWNADLPGSSGHLHQSLWDGEGHQNLFSDPKEAHKLSRLAKSYIAGLVHVAPELTALYAPFVNSYKRYVPGVWAPLSASWGIENRTCAIRVINGPGADAARVEYRQTAADIHPHIAMATCLAAGLHGVESGLEPPPADQGDATNAGAPLPPTLDAAVEALRESVAAREILGEAFVDHYLRTREWEVRQYRKVVGRWELQRYFEAV